MLEISESALAALEAKSIADWHRKAIEYLRECAPAHVSKLDDIELTRRIAIYQQEAESLGLVTERDILRWAYLQTIAGNRLFDQPLVRQQFDPGYSGRLPSEMLDLLFDDVAERLRRQD